MGEKFYFSEPLIEGLIKSRPNRFIMMVDVDGKTVKCHCPATGRIGNIVFTDIPCLLSKAKGEERKTAYTVEAISLSMVGEKNKKWIGINQNRINRYVEYFFRKGDFSKITNSMDVRREVQLGKSRIDFLVGKDYVEVKMPLIFLPDSKNVSREEKTVFNSFDRMIKHFNELGKSLKSSNRAILLMCYLYNAERFAPPKTNEKNKIIKNAARRAFEKGVENWQANFKIDSDGVELLDYFKLNLFN